MCSRYVLLHQHLREVLAKLGIASSAAAQTLPRSRYNIPPGGGIPVVRQSPPRREASASTDSAAGVRQLVSLRWGFVPSWARSPDQAPANARAETLTERPSFREAYRARRCLVPVSGFFEWHAYSRQPWLFRRRDEAPVCLAALWETWRASDGTFLESCAVVTTTPNAVMAPIHHRMPAIIGEAHYERWLDPRVNEPATLAPLLQPYPAEDMQAQALDSYVNNVAHDDPDCLAPTAPAAPRQDPQYCLRFD